MTRDFSSDKLRFAAHLGLYPVCWTHRTVIGGTSVHYKRSTYRRVNAANNGKGGYVKIAADAEAARRSREFAVEFFRRQLADGP